MMIPRRRALRLVFAVLLLALAAVFSAAQEEAPPEPSSLDAMNAREEFRLGVQAFNRYAFNEAILSFERALAFLPGESLILDWLGRAYYRSGLEEIALRQWQTAAVAYGAATPEALILQSKVETLRNRRTAPRDGESRYVESGHFPGRYDGITAFRQPSAVLPLEDGSAWVVAYGSNEILQIDVNGIIRQRRRGPVNGFDRPYDIIRGPGGRLFLSEYRGGRVSVLNGDGEWLSYIGSRGIGEGQLLGPQNLALDAEGYLYVVDYGNRRISKYDPDGRWITSFGGRESPAGDFPGLFSPTGIAAGEGRIFVADGGRIYGFDSNGRYMGVLIDTGLARPESLRLYPDGRLLTVDNNRLLLVDINTALITEIGIAGNSRSRIVGAGADQNGNILAANFNNDEILVMTPMDEIASGLFVQIDRVIADNFPQVTVEIQVQNRRRQPVVGLERRNFLVSENGQAVTEQNFLYAGYRSADTDVALLFERSPETLLLREDLAAAARDVGAASGRVVSVVSASEQPIRDWAAIATRGVTTGGDQRAAPAALNAAALGSAESYTPRWRLDAALRLAATDLLPGAKKRAVVYVGTGVTGELAYDRYSLSELAAYLANNGIVFHAVIIGQANGGSAVGLANQAGDDIVYLCGQTGGTVMPLYRPEGVGPILETLKVTPSGSYILNYRSMLPTDFGRAYLPIEAEVYLLMRSGRDTTGYFPPRE
jgi:sugar lactone lactonase YvrE